MIKYLLLLLFFSNDIGAFFNEFEYARDLKLSNNISKGNIIGPPGTWVNVFSFKIGGILKEQRSYCSFFKSPLAGKMGEFIILESERCEWTPRLEPIVKIDNIEYFQIQKNKKELEINYRRDSRIQKKTYFLINEFNNFNGVVLIPTTGKLKTKEKSKRESLCGLRNNPACVRKIGFEGRDQCNNLSDFYFCSPGTTMTCKNQRVSCL